MVVYLPRGGASVNLAGKPASGGIVMLRQRLTDSMKQAMKERDALTLSTVRLILARLKERDIEARPGGNITGIADPEIEQMMQAMIKQRHESILLYEQGKRLELAEKERGEIAIIARFLPQPLSDAELEAAIRETIAAVGAQGIKDMGRVMAALKERFAARLDPAKAGLTAKKLLG
jgi:uncharacterized protein